MQFRGEKDHGTFAEVNKILDSAVAAWTARVGTPPQLGVHSTDFGWETKDQLLSATAFGLRLIDPALIGNNSASKTHLIEALRTGVPFGHVGNWPRMPMNGPYVSEDAIKVIEAWIDAGTPD